MNGDIRDDERTGRNERTKIERMKERNIIERKVEKE